MELNFKEWKNEKSDDVLVILHGFLGSSKNWMTAGRALSKNISVYALDLRNHGQSPHSSEMDYAALEADLAHFLDKEKLEHIFLLGHSMGGKVAMRFSCHHEANVKGLIIEDITPKDYKPMSILTKAMEGMQAIDLKRVQTRKDAEEQIASIVEEKNLRLFLLSNLERKENGFAWTLNVDALESNREILLKNSLDEDSAYHGPTLILKGEKSSFIGESDKTLFEKYFPNNQFQTIENAGHNLHTDNREAFLKHTLAFLERNDTLKKSTPSPE